MASAPGGMVVARAAWGDTTCGNALVETSRTEGKKVSWILLKIGRILDLKQGLGGSTPDLLLRIEKLGTGTTILIGIRKQTQGIIRREGLIRGKKI